MKQVLVLVLFSTLVAACLADDSGPPRPRRVGGYTEQPTDGEDAKKYGPIAARELVKKFNSDKHYNYTILKVETQIVNGKNIRFRLALQPTTCNEASYTSAEQCDADPNAEKQFCTAVIYVKRGENEEPKLGFNRCSPESKAD